MYPPPMHTSGTSGRCWLTTPGPQPRDNPQQSWTTRETAVGYRGTNHRDTLDWGIDQMSSKKRSVQQTKVPEDHAVDGATSGVLASLGALSPTAMLAQQALGGNSLMNGLLDGVGSFLGGATANKPTPSPGTGPTGGGPQPLPMLQPGPLGPGAPLGPWMGPMLPFGSPLFPTPMMSPVAPTNNGKGSKAPAKTKPPKKPTPDQQVDKALANAKSQLDTGITDWYVSDKEANSALGGLTSLPPKLQGKAVDKMDKGDFETMLSNVPEKDHLQLKSLVDATTDPEKKLKLWAKYHKAKAKSDASAVEKKESSDEGSMWPWKRTDQQNENRRLNKRRDQIVGSTKSEVNDEVSEAMKLHAKGKLTTADVQQIIDRKNKELKLELKYNVNLTNEEGSRKKSIAGQSKGTKIAWSSTELDQVDKALSRMPEEHVKGNSMLKEIRRGEIANQEKDPNNPRIGGDHSNGVIRVFDMGLSTGFRHDGDAAEGWDAKRGGTLTSLEVTLTHEIGHDIHDQNPEAFKHFQEACDWQEGQGAGALTKGGVTPAQLKDLKSGKIRQVTVNGRTYSVDPYKKGLFGGKRFVSFKEGTIPTPGAGSTPNNRGGDTWSYGRTHPAEHFAETYMKAVNKPETLAKDLIDTPGARTTQAKAARDAAKTSLDALKLRKPPPSKKQLKAAETALKAQEASLKDARSDQKAQQAQFDVMRNEVFHTDKATTDAVSRLQAKGVPKTKIAEFKRKAGRLCTPDQVGLLEAGY